MPATLIASAAAPSRSSDHTGIRLPRLGPVFDERPGKANGTSTAMITVRIASTPKAQRHEPNWANSPPAAGPARVPTPHIAVTTADALVYNDCGRAALMTA